MKMHKSLPRIQELETFGVLAAFSLLMALVTQRQWLIYLALALLLVGLFVRPVAAVITRNWLKFSTVIGTVNSKVVLSLVFYFFLTPIALVYRIFNRNPMQLRNTDSASYFVDRNHTYSQADFEKMW